MSAYTDAAAAAPQRHIVAKLHPCCRQGICVYTDGVTLELPEDGTTVGKMQEKYRGVKRPEPFQRQRRRVVRAITEEDWQEALPKRSSSEAGHRANGIPLKLSDSILDKVRAAFENIRSVSTVTTGERPQRYRELAEAFGDFRDVAAQYAENIVFELGVSDEDKSHDADPNAGGLAGGEKIVCIECVRFKNPERNTAKLYPMPHKALKTCKHELIGTDAFIEALLRTKDKIKVTPIPAPCVVVDYLGSRLFASLNLPLGKRVVGMDGANLAEPPQNEKEYVEVLNTVLANCGLKPHKLNQFPEANPCALPFDAEVFQSSRIGDHDMMFLVDLARMIPPREKDQITEEERQEEEQREEEQREQKRQEEKPKEVYVTPGNPSSTTSDATEKKNPPPPTPADAKAAPRPVAPKPQPAPKKCKIQPGFKLVSRTIIDNGYCGETDDDPHEISFFVLERDQDQKVVIQRKSKYTEYLYRHFRKEFVWRFANLEEGGGLLSPDALNKVSSTEENEIQAKAEEYYRDHVPREVVNYLNSIEKHVKVFSDDLVRIVHYHGLNLCDLGWVFYLLPPESPWRRRILVEVAARSFRRVVNNVLRGYVSTGDVHMSEVKKKIAELFNDVLGTKKNTGEQGKKVWECMNAWKNECFPSLSDVTLKREHIIQDGEERDYMLGNFMWVASELLGVAWEPALWNNIQEPLYFNTHAEPFTAALVRDVHPRVMEMNIAHHAQGVAQMSSDRESDDSKAALEAAMRSLKQALDRQPTNEHTLDRLARVYSGLAAKKGQPEELRAEYELKAEYLLKMAKDVPKPHADSLFAWGLHLLTSLKDDADEATKKRAFEEARESFKKALAADPDHRHAGMMLADVEFLGLGYEAGVVLEHLKAHGGQEGCNLLHHRLVFQCLNKQWEDAAETAAKLRQLLKNPSDEKDREIEENLSAFEKAIDVDPSQLM